VVANYKKVNYSNSVLKIVPDYSVCWVGTTPWDARHQCRLIKVLERVESINNGGSYSICQTQQKPHRMLVKLMYRYEYYKYRAIVKHKYVSANVTSPEAKHR
jgi:hypothetical protein